VSEILSLRAINRALLSRQRLLGGLPYLRLIPAKPRAAMVVETIEHLVGLQAQAPFPP